MLYRQPISDKQLAPFLEAAKLMTIPMNEVPPFEIEEVLAPSKSSNETILVMNQAMIAQAIKMNTENVVKYEELKERWYCDKAEDDYVAVQEAKRKAEEEAAKRKAEEAVVKAAAEKENERAMDVNSEGEDEVDLDKTPKLKSKKKTKSRSIVDSESEEETEEVKAKRRKVKGKGKAVDPEYKRNMVPVDYAGCPGVPVCKICEGCKVPPNAWYQRPCMGDVQMDANDQIFYVRSKDCCFVCLMRSNVCSFTCDDEVDFIMPEAADDKELQAKLRKLCDEQDTFKKQKDKEKAERSKNVGNSTKSGTKKTVQVNVKASGSTPKVVSEDNDIVVEACPKRARTVVNSTWSNERIPSVAESLHGINQALIQTVTLLGDNQAANENTARYLCGIETCMANLQSAMQMHVGQVHYRLGELERRAGIWPVEDKEFVDKEVEPAEPEVMEEEVEEVCEEIEEVRKETEEVREEIEEVRKEIEEVRKEIEEVREEDKEDETMKDPEVDEL
ncbi:hypothetical protein M422DRAFT_273937 [Sphaerobolus stellatus SS14]|uniref:Uncharacterized protein n=1 Tax=Sphaerobolus stellatus (strain SS14) TaxID=990650 RepID=A0A0C9U7Q0_SPHS4|nr:hypothetical protein M422DRAFT_273937 [Sphaerobolus stellatus SS14]